MHNNRDLAFSKIRDLIPHPCASIRIAEEPGRHLRLGSLISQMKTPTSPQI
jgi:hypothetical protein